MQKSKNGFTIVELLIVIVVIGVLATITIATYNGVQNRAYDVAIQSDLSNYAKKVEAFRADSGSLMAIVLADFEALGLKASAGAYVISPTVTRNYIYCPNLNNTDYAVVAKSKSGNAFIIRNSTSIQPFTSSWTSGTTAGSLCDSIDGAGGTYNTTSVSGYWTGQSPNWATWTGVT